jgi:predicted nucleic acid-binding protein
LKVVDSTFLIGLLLGESNAAKKAAELDAAGGAATSVVSVFQVSCGVSRMMRDPGKRLGELRRLVANLEVLPLSVEASLRASEICGVYVGSGRWINPFDAMVAGIAVTCGVESLVTRMAAAYDLVSGLKLEDYMK